jgi:hypothetical protein
MRQRLFIEMNERHWQTIIALLRSRELHPQEGNLLAVLVLSPSLMFQNCTD